ncbi:MAG: hypothetical protein ACRDPW_10330 [Mycobacteriales bacterium]
MARHLNPGGKRAKTRTGTDWADQAHAVLTAAGFDRPARIDQHAQLE